MFLTTSGTHNLAHALVIHYSYYYIYLQERGKDKTKAHYY